MTHMRALGAGHPATMMELPLQDHDQVLAGDLPGQKRQKLARSQHCEVEKRRRERMNRYMNELAQMIPTCAAVPRRLDKLSILKMAVDHMKTLRGDLHSSSPHRPGFLTDDELKHLVVEAANGFMVIIECSWARILFVSDTISDVLGEPVETWMGTSFYDLLHPKDIQKVKSQLTCFDLDEAMKASVKNNVGNSPLVLQGQNINGLRRSFLCRVRRNTADQSSSSTSGDGCHGDGVDYQRSEDVIRLLQSTQQNVEQQYAVLHCTGFIRHLTTTEQQALKMEEGSSGACLIAVARLQHFGDGTPRAAMEASENEFVARVGTDGRFTYVDPRVVGVLGYLPQDLIGQVSYEYYHPEDIQKMVQLHHDAMKRRTPMPTVQYRVLSKAQKWVWLAMKAFSFINPFSQQVEYVVCTNVAMRMTKQSDQGVIQREEQPALPAPPSSSSSTGDRFSLPLQQQGAGGGGGREEDPISALFPDLVVPQQTPGAIPSANSSGQMMSWAGDMATSLNMAPAYSIPPSAPFLTSPAKTSLEENAAKAQQMLVEFQQQVAQPQRRKDMNIEFPPGLFPSEQEIDLEGSQQAYQILQAGLDDPSQFMNLFTQLEADPFRQQHMLGDIDLLD
jgi:PAS domain S-box-containing protein